MKCLIEIWIVSTKIWKWWINLSLYIVKKKIDYDEDEDDDSDDDEDKDDKKEEKKSIKFKRKKKDVKEEKNLISKKDDITEQIFSLSKTSQNRQKNMFKRKKK